MSSTSTKEKLMEAATKLFAQQGYDATSVRDICLEARVNNASINYHFGDKRSLYRAVITRGVAQSPSLNLPSSSGTPEERLHALILAALSDIFETRDNTIVIVRELLDPPEDVLELLSGPTREYFLGVLEVISELADGRLDDLALQIATLGLLGQITYFRTSHKFIPHVLGEERTEMMSVSVLADYITRATIQSLRPS